MQSLLELINSQPLTIRLMINACHTCKWLRKKENFENNISTVHIIWCSFILNWIKVLDITFLSKCANIKFERQEYIAGDPNQPHVRLALSIQWCRCMFFIYCMLSRMSLQLVVLSLCLISFSQLRDLQTKWQGRLIIPLSDFTSNIHYPVYRSRTDPSKSWEYTI